VIRIEAQQAFRRLLPLQGRLESTISELRANLKSFDYFVQEDSLQMISEVILVLPNAKIVRAVQETLHPVLLELMSSENNSVISSAAKCLAYLYVKLGDDDVTQGLQ
jgi:hypothetical protein